MRIGGHLETHNTRSRDFREWLCYQFWKRERKAPSGKALQEALNTIAGQAKFEGKSAEVYLRYATSEGSIFIDLCNEDWEIIEVSSDGWKKIAADKAQVIFRRTPSMASLPNPIANGDLQKLNRFVNATPEQTMLIKAWIVAAMRPGLPFPVLIIKGEQGTAKTTLTRILRALVDPSEAPCRSCPRDERDLVISANNSWVIALDNISQTRPWLSDGLCRIATGGGFSTRTLYTDDEETVFNSKRPIILNGIGNIANREDLLDRALVVSLEPIPESKRKTEQAFFADFEKEMTGIFSGLLDSLSEGLRSFDSVSLSSVPRMADFAKWATACEPSFRDSDQRFIELYTSNRVGINSILLEDSPLSQSLHQMQSNGDEFEGSMSDLLKRIKSCADQDTVDQRGFPKTPRGLRGQLDRIAPNLRQIGIRIEYGTRTSSGSQVRIRFKRNGKDS